MTETEIDLLLPRDKDGTGIYMIRNLINEKKYVGSASQSLRYRFRSHVEQLRRGKHYNSHLQNAWNRYGEAAFEFEVLQYCQPAFCIIHEQYYIDYYRAAEKGFGYNGRPTAESNRGKKFGPQSPEHVAKRKAAGAFRGNRRGSVNSPEARAKISASTKGKPRPMTPARWAAAKARRGIPRSEETKRKIGDSNAIALKGKKGHPQSAETRAKISAAHKGRKGKKASPELRAKLSAIHMKIWALRKTARLQGVLFQSEEVSNYPH